MRIHEQNQRLMKYMDTLLKYYIYLWIWIALAIICIGIGEGEEPLRTIFFTAIICCLVCYWSFWIFFHSFCLIRAVFTPEKKKKKKKKKSKKKIA